MMLQPNLVNNNSGKSRQRSNLKLQENNTVQAKTTKNLKKKQTTWLQNQIKKDKIKLEQTIKNYSKVNNNQDNLKFKTQPMSHTLKAGMSGVSIKNQYY